MKMLGIALVILGIVALVYGGFGYSRNRTLIDVGGVKATTTEHRTFPVAPITGAIALVGGILLLVSPRWRRA